MKAIIVDDEYLAREELKYFIQNYSEIQVVAELSDGAEALKYLQKNQVDAIFLDINIPFLDGVLLAKSISSFEHKPYIIFITAYREHAVEAFEIEAFDYILKPYSEVRILSMLHKLEHAGQTQSAPQMAESAQQSTKINLWKQDKIMVTDVREICYCEANERVTRVFTAKEEYQVNQSISELYEQLPKDMFFRCHRSYIVNLSKISEIIPWFNGTYNIKLNDVVNSIPVSRGNAKEFKQLMHI